MLLTVRAAPCRAAAFDGAPFLLIEDLAAFTVAIGQQVRGVAVDLCFFMFAAQHTQHCLMACSAQYVPLTRKRRLLNCASWFSASIITEEPIALRRL